VAQKLITLLTDDLNGKQIPAGEGETFDFAFQGYAYSIDLDNRNAKKFRDAMSTYVDRARRTGKADVLPLRRSDAARRADEVEPGLVRAWAEANGYEISPRGRIRNDVVEAYLAAQG